MVVRIEEGGRGSQDPRQVLERRVGEVGAEKGGLSGAPTQRSGAPGWARRQEPSGLEGVSGGSRWPRCAPHEAGAWPGRGHTPDVWWPSRAVPGRGAAARYVPGASPGRLTVPSCLRRIYQRLHPPWRRCVWKLRTRAHLGPAASARVLGEHPLPAPQLPQWGVCGVTDRRKNGS